MWQLAGRNAVVIGAALAALLLIMQLRAQGVAGYEFADVVSILLFAVPTALRRVRPSDRPRPRRREPVGDATSDPTVTPSEPAVPSRPPTAAEERALVIERLAVWAVALVIACGSYLLLVLLVLSQAWTPALSAAMVCGLALAAIPRHGGLPHPSSPAHDDTG